MGAIGLLVRCSLACLLAHARKQMAGDRRVAKGGEVPGTREADRGGELVGHRRSPTSMHKQLSDRFGAEQGPAQHESDKEACAICLDDLLEEADVLACGHRFHKKCTALLVAEWVSRCPLCRSQSLQNRSQITADLIKSWLEVSQEIWKSDASPLSRALQAGSNQDLEAFYQEGVIQTLTRFLREGSQEVQERAAECFWQLLARRKDVEPEMGRQMIGAMHDAGTMPEIVRLALEGSHNAQRSAVMILMFLSEDWQSHRMICEAGGIRALVRASRRAGFGNWGLAAVALDKLSQNKQNSKAMDKEGGTRALRMMYFEDFPAIIYGCVFWSIAGLFTQISAGIEIILGRLKQVRQALSRRSRTSQSESSTGPSGTEASLHVVQLRKPHLHMVTIAGGAGVFNAALIFCHWGRSMREVEQPLLVV
eukprot:gnl/TRDRNA2_/TRDRNA2_175499_c1_seq15.p1 gnl/TRDRNA2_/TRDRNA2_175499_c1~~gnl/TRDRNA2_/TRDRNA2_175499_c1_seq15.p1  ORF type:complete len:423 (+),score=57.68 gnl/TRDRNA2_/TRDRNA2_175499_c1_seq15:56-1324(+)